MQEEIKFWFGIESDSRVAYDLSRRRDAAGGKDKGDWALLTAEQREQRRGYLGSSEIAIAFGCSPFSRNSADLALIKRGFVDEEDIDRDTDDKQAGNYFESGIGRWAQDRLGMTHAASQWWVTNKKYPFAAATLDYVLKTGNGREDAILECKLVGGSKSNEWGDESEGPDGIPVYYLTQVVWQLGVTGWPVAYVAAVIAGYFGHELRVYRIDRDEEMIEATMEAGRRWWQRFVIDGETPEVLPNVEVIRKRKREAGKVVEIADATAFVEWDRLRDSRLAAEKAEKSALSKCLVALGDADSAVTPDGVFEFGKDKSGKRTPRWKGKNE